MRTAGNGKDGYVKVWRQMTDWEWYKDVNTKVLFIHLMLCANRYPIKYKGLDLEPGCWISSVRQLSQECGLSVQSTRTAIKHLISTQELTQTNYPKFTVFKLNNYQKYQEANTVTNKQPTQYQHSTNTVPTQEQEGKEGKEGKEKRYSRAERDAVPSQNSCPAEEIIEYLNKQAGKKFKASKASTTHIRARWNEGYSLDDFHSVIDKKCGEWLGDSKMEKFLRPATLFGSKFDDYLNQPDLPSERSSARLPDWYANTGDAGPTDDLLAEIEQMRKEHGDGMH